MSRSSKVLYLTPQQRATVDACIRKHHYVNILKIVAHLAEDGIELSKSGLHRYAVQLRARDAQHAGTVDDTLVIIVERSTGATTSLTSSASRDAITGAVASLGK